MRRGEKTKEERKRESGGKERKTSRFEENEKRESKGDKAKMKRGDKARDKEMENGKGKEKMKRAVNKKIEIGESDKMEGNSEKRGTVK